MTTLEERPDVGAEPPEEHVRARGLLAFLTTTDHKRIGISYMVTAFAFYLIGGALAMVIRAELAEPGSQVVSQGRYNEMFTMHGSIMLFLFLGPFAFGLANYFVPLQVGARDMAFPRLNALSYWFYLFGGVTMLTGFLTADGAADFGWTGYTPAVVGGALAQPRQRPVADGGGADRPVGRAHRGEHRGDGRRHARPGHAHVPAADLHVEHARHEHPRADRLPRGDQRRHHAVRRPSAGGPHLRPGRARRRRGLADPVAAPVLVLRPPRGLHPRAAVLRGDHRDPAGVLAAAGVRLRRTRLRHDRHRRAVGRRVGPPHVRDRGRRCCRSSRASRC